MNSDRAGTILLMVILVILSAYFSAIETAFSSLSRGRVKSLADDGNKRAKLVLQMLEQYDRLLSTILIGDNISNIAMASIGTLFFMELFGPNSAPLAILVVIAIILIIGEISPKSMAQEAPERFALFSAPILRVLMVVLLPLTFLFVKWKQLLARVFHLSEDRGMTEDELLNIVEEAEQDGGINEEESELIRSAIEFNDREAKDILIPRVDVEAVSVADDKEKIARTFRETNFSRLPVYEETIDHIVGILLEKDFHNRAYGTEVPVEAVLKPAVFVSEGMQLRGLLQLLQKNKSHMAIVADEYGGTVGIVTMEDILEELVGEIWDEHDEVVEDIREIAPNCYRVLCSVSLDKLLGFFKIREEPESATVNGWVMEQLGKIPEPGDCFTYNRLTVEVLCVEDRRTEVLKITAGPEVEAEE